MVAMPGAMPMTIPDDPIAAIHDAPEVQVPPPVLLERVVVALAQTFVVPVIAAGNGLTVMVLVATALPQLSDTE